METSPAPIGIRARVVISIQEQPNPHSRCSNREKIQEEFDTSQDVSFVNFEKSAFYQLERARASPRFSFK